MRAVCRHGWPIRFRGQQTAAGTVWRDYAACDGYGASIPVSRPGLPGLSKRAARAEAVRRLGSRMVGRR